VTIRTTVHPDDVVIARVRQRIPRRGLSRFGNEARAEKIEALEQPEIEAEMIADYQAGGGSARDR
jgi:hypothetical protein